MKLKLHNTMTNRKKIYNDKILTLLNPYIGCYNRALALLLTANRITESYVLVWLKFRVEGLKATLGSICLISDNEKH